MEILNTLDASFETSVKEYKALVQTKDKVLSAHKDEMASAEQKLKDLLKIVSTLFDYQATYNLFSSLEWPMELVILSPCLGIAKDSVDVIHKYFLGVTKEILNQHKNQLPRLIHQVSMMVLHQNLYNNE